MSEEREYLVAGGEQGDDRCNHSGKGDKDNGLLIFWTRTDASRSEGLQCSLQGTYQSTLLSASASWDCMFLVVYAVVDSLLLLVSQNSKLT